MAEYIERDSFLSCKRNQYCMNCERRKNSNGKVVYAIGDAPCRACDIRDVLNDVEDFPAADVRPVVRGKWIDEPIKGIRYHCSVCQGRFDYTWRYCPNCGADMRGEKDV